MYDQRFFSYRREQSKLQKVDESIRRALDHPLVIHWICLALLVLTLWGVLYSQVQNFTPGTQAFGVFALFLMAYVGGELTRLVKLPPLLGMLIVGLILRNTGFVHFTGKFNRMAAILRHAALFIILTRAGLGLDPKALKSLSFIIMRLAFCPALVEGFSSMVLTHYLLELPWLWGGVLGAILAAVSPAVVIPCLFALQDKGYGTDKGIPTLVVAAASLDDILSISIYGVLINMVFSPGECTIFGVLSVCKYV